MDYLEPLAEIEPNHGIPVALSRQDHGTSRDDFEGPSDEPGPEAVPPVAWSYTQFDKLERVRKPTLTDVRR
jgi:hypothetical protein